MPSQISSIYEPLVDPSGCQPPPSRVKLRVTSLFQWWLPEIVASALSVASLLSMVILLRKYKGRGIDHLDLPSWLTLNGIIALLSTLNRVCLMLPVGAAMSQEAWLWFSTPGQTERCNSRLRDLELTDAASRGAWGSLVLLCVSRWRCVTVKMMRCQL